jgi:hypothetical protein
LAGFDDTAPIVNPAQQQIAAAREHSSSLENATVICSLFPMEDRAIPPNCP